MKKSTGKSNKLRLEYKLTIIGTAISMLIVLYILVFSLFPLYDLVGNNIQSSIESDKTIKKSEDVNSVAIPALIVVVAFTTLNIAIAIYKDVSKRQPKQISTKSK